MLPTMLRVNLFALLFSCFSALVSAGYLQYCKNFSLEQSSQDKHRLFLKADCLGMYGDTTTFQCSYLDLNQCFTLKNQQFYAQRLGNGLVTRDVSNCRLSYADPNYQNAQKATGMECSKTGELGGTYTADFRAIIGADIGFLTCYNRGGFLCPQDGEDAPY